MKTVSSRGFTLVELLVVIGVLSLLMGLLVPAILKSMKTAMRRARNNECAVLESALTQYWHDQNKWPIGGTKKPEKDNDYKISYRDDNYLVFDQLLKDQNSALKKDYLDPAVHLSTSESVTDWPSFSAASLKDIINGNDEKKIRARKNNRVLVYWCDYIQCPKCDPNDVNRFSDADNQECHNNNCSYYKDYGSRYQFKSTDRRNAVRGLLPYRVTFDMLNNTVDVSE